MNISRVIVMILTMLVLATCAVQFDRVTINCPKPAAVCVQGRWDTVPLANVPTSRDSAGDAAK